MKFEEMTVGAFIDELASNSPAPGGGSVAALCGSLASGLTAMVGNLTIGKEKYKDNWETMEKVFKESETLRASFVKLMNDDTDSFNIFMAAMKMPKDTDEQKAARKAAMAEARSVMLKEYSAWRNTFPSLNSRLKPLSPYNDENASM